jgi:hypothetical protein
VDRNGFLVSSSSPTPHPSVDSFPEIYEMSDDGGQFHILEESFEDHMAHFPSPVPGLIPGLVALPQPGGTTSATPHPPIAPHTAPLAPPMVLPTSTHHPFNGIRIISNGCYGTIVGATLSPRGTWTFINQRDDVKLEELTKMQVENGMSLVSQLRIQMAGFDLNQFVNPNYQMSPKHTAEGWSSNGHTLIGYRVARNFTNKPSPCYGTIVAVHTVLLRTVDIDEGFYFFNLHDDGDTEELSMQDLMTSIEMWVWYARQTRNQTDDQRGMR